MKKLRSQKGNGHDRLEIVSRGEIDIPKEIVSL